MMSWHSRRCRNSCKGIINGRIIKKDGRVARGQPEAISGGLPDMGSEDGQVPF
jgi:hypothetical protein